MPTTDIDYREMACYKCGKWFWTKAKGSMVTCPDCKLEPPPIERDPLKDRYNNAEIVVKYDPCGDFTGGHFYKTEIIDMLCEWKRGRVEILSDGAKIYLRSKKRNYLLDYSKLRTKTIEKISKSNIEELFTLLDR